MVAKLPVHTGACEAEDVLPPTLASGSLGLLSYRIELLNGAGRSAGQSAGVFAASGEAPPVIAGFAATPIRKGVRLSWSADAGTGVAGSSIELDRVQISAATVAQPQRRRSPALGGADTSPTEVHLGVGTPGQPDSGGALDRSAQKDVTYRYIAQRLVNTVVGGQTLTVRSLPSEAATVTVLDTFPPQPLSGLEAAAGGGQSSGIDLSWRPGAEADLAGYNVYRREPGTSGAWLRLNGEPVPVPAYTDSAVQPATRYAYRVTAVDSNGNESAPGPEVQETPQTR